ncbi:hypothetical protein VE04_08865 [Pseudogymnoascus sp. 24MN13]|nr:hypothetical protein VE04_08865 [Pseudogymnoascus sp. 24MN13]
MGQSVALILLAHGCGRCHVDDLTGTDTAPLDAFPMASLTDSSLHYIFSSSKSTYPSNCPSKNVITPLRNPSSTPPCPTKSKKSTLVVGGGFSGTRLLNLLKNKVKLHSVVGIEKGDSLGGTWYWNQYPGAQTDTESWVYRFADEREPAEIVESARKNGTYEDFIFGTEVKSARYDGERKRWEIETDKGHRFSATYFVTAVGILNNPNIPTYPGIDTFKGQAFHSARWPKGLDVTGKRVAVIGTGPSGSQITGAINKIVKQLTVFQQRAQYITPVNNRPVDEVERAEIYKNYDTIWDTVFQSLFAMGFVESKKSALEASEEERREVYERVWNKGGGFRFFFETFGDLGTSIEANETAAANPVAKLTETGIELRDGKQLEFDVIIFATGFDSVDGSYRNVDITGREGVKLNDVWKNGATSLYGVSVTQFPNLFLVSGPGGPFSNIPPSIEVQGDFITKLILESQARGTKTVEADKEAQGKWDETVQAISAVTIFSKVKSWVQNDNVEGKTKYSAFFLAGLGNYIAKLEEETGGKYPSFRFE